MLNLSQWVRNTVISLGGLVACHNDPGVESSLLKPHGLKIGGEWVSKWKRGLFPQERKVEAECDKGHTHPLSAQIPLSNHAFSNGADFTADTGLSLHVGRGEEGRHGGAYSSVFATEELDVWRFAYANMSVSMADVKMLLMGPFCWAWRQCRNSSHYCTPGSCHKPTVTIIWDWLVFGELDQINNLFQVGSGKWAGCKLEAEMTDQQLTTSH